MSSIKEKELTTKLTNERIEKSIRDYDECSASCLLNGVNHIWTEQIIAPSDGLDGSANEEEINKEAASACLTIAQGQAMNNLVVAADCIDVGDKVNKDFTKLHKYCISNPWTDGAVIMCKVNYF